MTSSASSSDPARRVRIMALLVVLLAAMAQMALWWNTRAVFPRATVLTEPASASEIDLLSLSDRQFFYRSRTMDLQTAGDLGGNVTPLTEFNYALLYRWFRLLDSVDPGAQYLPTLAGYYYSQTLKTEDVRHVVQFLREHARHDPPRKWRWMAHAAWLARHRVNDVRLALDVAEELAALKVPGIPVWTKQLPAFLLADVGEKEAARDLIMAILGSDMTLAREERFFMERFLEERLK